MPACAVKGCYNFKGTKTTYGFKSYRFPRDENICKQWVIATGRSDKFNVRTARICSDHFDLSCIEIPKVNEMCNYHPKNARYLKKDAVPTLKLPFVPDDENIETIAELSEKKQSVNLEVVPVQEFEILNSTNSDSQNYDEIIQDVVNEIHISSKQDLQKCRLCLSLAKLQPVQDSQFKKYATNFLNFIQVQIGHKLPDNICEDCLNELNGIASFIKKCKDSCEILEKAAGHCKNIKPSYQNDNKIELLDHVGYIRTDEINIKDEGDNTNSQQIATSLYDPVTEHTVMSENLSTMDTDITSQLQIDTPVYNSATKRKITRENRHTNNIDDASQQAATYFYDPVTKLIIMMTRNCNKKNININSQQVDPSVYDQVTKLTIMSEKCDTENAQLVATNLDTSDAKFIPKTESTNTAKEKINSEGSIKSETENSTIDAKKSDFKKFVKKSTKDSKEPKTCKKCGESIKSKGDHYKMSRSCYPAKYKCSMCNACFSSKDKLQNHQRAHHWTLIPQIRLMCHICSQFFKYESTFRRHMRVHEHGKEHMCEVCGKSYTTPGQLKGHLNTHYNKKPYACRYCEKSFTSYTIRFQHHKFHEREAIAKASGLKTSTDNVVCEICCRQFTHDRFLKLHMKTHDENRVYKCQFCKETFKTVQLLREHSGKHTEEKQFSCSFCDKRFHSRLEVANHSRTHTGERPFKCSICNHSFRHGSNLRRHKMIIHNENRMRPFKCRVCNKAFTMKYSLTVHMKIHTRKERFLCTICNKSFSDSKTGKRHIRMKHAEDEVKRENKN